MNNRMVAMLDLVCRDCKGDKMVIFKLLLIAVDHNGRYEPELLMQAVCGDDLCPSKELQVRHLTLSALETKFMEKIGGGE